MWFILGWSCAVDGMLRTNWIKLQTAVILVKNEVCTRVYLFLPKHHKYLCSNMGMSILSHSPVFSVFISVPWPALLLKKDLSPALHYGHVCVYVHAFCIYIVKSRSAFTIHACVCMNAFCGHCPCILEHFYCNCPFCESAAISWYGIVCGVTDCDWLVLGGLCVHLFRIILFMYAFRADV